MATELIHSGMHPENPNNGQPLSAKRIIAEIDGRLRSNIQTDSSDDALTTVLRDMINAGPLPNVLSHIRSCVAADQQINQRIILDNAPDWINYMRQQTVDYDIDPDTDTFCRSFFQTLIEAASVVKQAELSQSPKRKPLKKSFEGRKEKLLEPFIQRNEDTFEWKMDTPHRYALIGLTRFASMVIHNLTREKMIGEKTNAHSYSTFYTQSREFVMELLATLTSDRPPLDFDQQTLQTMVPNRTYRGAIPNGPLQGRQAVQADPGPTSLKIPK